MSDFSVHIAGEILDLMTQGTVRTPPSNIFNGNSQKEESQHQAIKQAGQRVIQQATQRII